MKKFLVSVKSVDTLEGYQKKIETGVTFISEIDALGVFFYDADRHRGYIVLNNELKNQEEYKAIYHILHELAHAFEYYKYKEEVDSRLECIIELGVCSQVIVWLTQSLQQYEQSINSTLYALFMAQFHWQQWKQPLKFVDQTLELLAKELWVSDEDLEE